METKQVSILLDTNIWLDYYLPERTTHAKAEQLITFAFDHQLNLCFSSHATSDVFYIVSQAQKHELQERQISIDEKKAECINEIAWGCVTHMSDIANAIPVDLRSLWLAKRYKSFERDYGDGLVLAACELANIDYLITDDEDLLKKSPTAALSLDNALEILPVMFA